jgi:predicted ATPase
VELAPLSEGDLVTQEVAGALEVSERPGEPLIDTLVDVIGSKNLLLVLDNCEHLVEATAQLVDALLDSCPHLRVLATSREPLGIGGEVLWRVPPLSLPDQTDGEPDGESAIESLVRYEAVRLFVDRARLRLLDFKLTQENAGAVLRVCLKLDGIPLAIELATARMGTLAVEQVAQRLEVSLDLLKGANRTAAPRQQTLRATLDWSYDLLSEAEQTLFGRLSVFAGGWTLEAAEEVCSGRSIEQEDVLDLLGALVDKSLVLTGARTEGAVRYRMLEPIRQYAREKLEVSAEADVIRYRHYNHFLGLAAEAEPMLQGSQQGAWLKRLEGEHDNLREAISWSLNLREAGPALRLVGVLCTFWLRRGHLDEGRGWLEAALAKDGEVATPVKAKALSGLGSVLASFGDYLPAQTLYEDSLALYREADDSKGVADALCDLGYMALPQGDHEHATRLLEESLRRFRKLEDKPSIAFALLGLAHTAGNMAKHERAQALYEESLTLYREAGDIAYIADCTSSLGWVAMCLGDYLRATELLEEGIARQREIGIRVDAEYLNNLGLAV